MEQDNKRFGPLDTASAKKRKLTLLLKELHGDIWSREIYPKFDKRGLAGVYLLRYNNRECIEALSEYPIYRLQLDILKDAEIEELQVAIPMIIKATGRCVEVNLRNKNVSFNALWTNRIVDDRLVLNTEQQSRAMKSVAFWDPSGT